MLTLLVGLVAGAVLVGTAWAWCELRRDHRRQGAALALALTEHAAHGERLQRLTEQLAAARSTIHDHGQELEQLCERAGVARYTRSAKSS